MDRGIMHFSLSSLFCSTLAVSAQASAQGPISAIEPIAAVEHRTMSRQQRETEFPLANDFSNRIDEIRQGSGIGSISMAINLRGETLWKFGAGDSNVDAGYKTHGETVYALASVSKVVTSSLFGRLEERGQLIDGTPVDLESTQLTRQHLPQVPELQNHTLGQLLSHTGCVPHYDTEPALANATQHFSSQTQAVDRVLEAGLVGGCTIGEDLNYSSGSFTLIAASMEQEAGRDFSTLVREELSEAFDLPSLRVMYADTTLPANPDRVIPLDIAGEPISNGDNSWKAAGGGIESNAVDLARFGNLVGEGQITSPEFRDESLLRPRSNSRFAYGWIVSKTRGRRCVHHSGSWNGIAAELAVWPDHGLSIALLANRRLTGEEDTKLYKVATEFAAEILNDERFFPASDDNVDDPNNDGTAPDQERPVVLNRSPEKDESGCAISAHRGIAPVWLALGIFGICAHRRRRLSDRL